MKKVIIADNYPGVRNLLGLIVSEMDFETHVYGDSSQAYEDYLKNDSGLMILGGKLFTIGCMDMIKKIRKRDRDFPIIVVSGGYSETGLHYEDINYLESGTDKGIRYISKPFDNEEIREALDGLLRD